MTRTSTRTRTRRWWAATGAGLAATAAVLGTSLPAQAAPAIDAHRAAPVANLAAGAQCDRYDFGMARFGEVVCHRLPAGTSSYRGRLVFTAPQPPAGSGGEGYCLGPRFVHVNQVSSAHCSRNKTEIRVDFR